jgi:hypothetical protein
MLTQEQIEEAMWACSHEPINTERYRAGLKILREMDRERRKALLIRDMRLDAE